MRMKNVNGSVRGGGKIALRRKWAKPHGNAVQNSTGSRPQTDRDGDE